LSLSRTLDEISLGKIVVIREQLLKAQAAGEKVYRFESGDPSFAVAPHVLSALKTAADEGKTHYIPNAGIPQLRTAIFHKIQQKNHIQIRLSRLIKIKYQRDFIIGLNIYHEDIKTSDLKSTSSR